MWFFDYLQYGYYDCCEKIVYTYTQKELDKIKHCYYVWGSNAVFTLLCFWKLFSY